MALAPVAAALVVFSPGAGGLRVAAVLAILTVVLVGLAIMLRPDARTLRTDLEDHIFDEIDAVREEIRRDIATAARASHRAYSEKLQALHQTVEELRAQVEALRTGQAPAEPPTVPVSTPMVSGGVVRHTETVHVTTRQTIVDQEHANGYGDRANGYGAGGTVYGSRHAEPAHSARPEATGTGRPAASGTARPANGTARPADESWTEQRLRDRLTDTQAGQASREEHEPRRPRPYEREEPRGYHSDGAYAQDRWASMRADDRSQELRLGERRAAVRSDDTGTELHLEDRWAQMRRDRDDWERPARPAWTGPSHSAPALPASAPEPASAWTQGWRQDQGWQGEEDWRERTGGWREGTGGWRERTGGWRDETGGWREETGGWRDDTGDVRRDTGGWRTIEPAPANPRQRRPDYEIEERRWR